MPIDRSLDLFQQPDEGAVLEDAEIDRVLRHQVLHVQDVRNPPEVMEHGSDDPERQGRRVRQGHVHVLHEQRGQQECERIEHLPQPSQDRGSVRPVDGEIRIRITRTPHRSSANTPKRDLFRGRAAPAEAAVITVTRCPRCARDSASSPMSSAAERTSGGKTVVSIKTFMRRPPPRGRQTDPRTAVPPTLSRSARSPGRRRRDCWPAPSGHGPPASSEAHRLHRRFR